MDTEIVKALYLAKKYVLVKDILSKYVYEYSGNNDELIAKIYDKIGNCYEQLGNIDKAITHYKNSIIKNETNDEIYFKLARLYETKYDFLVEAEINYKHCLEINPIHSKCMFYLSKLNLKQNKLKEAKEWIMKCYETNDDKACVNYYLAIILMKEKCYEKNVQQQKFITCLLRTALEIQPHVIKYKMSLALHLEKIKETNDVIKLHNEVKCLRERLTYDELHFDVKLMIYDFDSIIQYHDIINHSINYLMNIREKELLILFGGRDRINIFVRHFLKILNDNINVVIRLSNDLEIKQILKLLGFHIIGVHILLLDSMNDVKNYINHQLLKKTQILYISANEHDNKSLNGECLIYHVNKSESKSIYGLSLDDINCLESFVINKKSMNEIKEIKNDKYKYIQLFSLKDKDPELFFAMQTDIINNKAGIPLHELKSFERALKKFMNDKYYIDFLTFGILFRRMIIAFKRNQWWVVVNVLNEIFLFERNDNELLRRYAKALSYLKHNEEAENIYMEIIEINPNDYWCLLSYGWHLLKVKEYKRAKSIFLMAENVSTFNIQDRSLYLGLAITMEHLNNYNSANNFYKLATRSEDEIMQLLICNEKYNVHGKGIMFYEPAHYTYGEFLMKNNNFQEAMKQFDICLKRTGYKNMTWTKFLYAQEALNTINKSMKFYNDDNKQFDDFWFDEIGIVTKDFNNYYDQILMLNLNDINWILNDNNIIEKLYEDVGVNNEQHLKLLGNAINEHRKYAFV